MPSGLATNHKRIPENLCTLSCDVCSCSTFRKSIRGKRKFCVQMLEIHLAAHASEKLRNTVLSQLRKNYLEDCDIFWNHFVVSLSATTKACRTPQNSPNGLSMVLKPAQSRKSPTTCETTYYLQFEDLIAQFSDMGFLLRGSYRDAQNWMYQILVNKSDGDIHGKEVNQIGMGWMYKTDLLCQIMPSRTLDHLALAAKLIENYLFNPEFNKRPSTIFDIIANSDSGCLERFAAQVWMEKVLERRGHFSHAEVSEIAERWRGPLRTRPPRQTWERDR